jgi:peptidoglycan/xylan/chitin deacetylase (PgdA/CDA1 family)
MEYKELRIQTLLVFTVVTLSTVTSTAFFLPAISYSQLSPTPSSNDIANTKVVILSFDDNRKGDFTYAKPILDKYGFKATFFIICGKTTDKGVMNWQDIAAIQRDGMDIESLTVTHKHLDHLSASALNFEIAVSKQCLANHGYNATSFAYPYDERADNVTVVNTVAKNYELEVVVSHLCS